MKRSEKTITSAALCRWAPIGNGKRLHAFVGQEYIAECGKGPACALLLATKLKRCAECERVLRDWSGTVGQVS